MVSETVTRYVQLHCRATPTRLRPGRLSGIEATVSSRDSFMQTPSFSISPDQWPPGLDAEPAWPSALTTGGTKLTNRSGLGKKAFNANPFGAALYLWGAGETPAEPGGNRPNNTGQHLRPISEAMWLERPPAAKGLKRGRCCILTCSPGRTATNPFLPFPFPSRWLAGWRPSDVTEVLPRASR